MYSMDVYPPPPPFLCVVGCVDCVWWGVCVLLVLFRCCFVRCCLLFFVFLSNIFMRGCGSELIVCVPKIELVGWLVGCWAHLRVTRAVVSLGLSLTTN
jgi:hypothetical protein